jgi:hypothetical protein
MRHVKKEMGDTIWLADKLARLSRMMYVCMNRPLQVLSTLGWEDGHVVTEPCEFEAFCPEVGGDASIDA